MAHKEKFCALQHNNLGISAKCPVRREGSWPRLNIANNIRICNEHAKTHYTCPVL